MSDRPILFSAPMVRALLAGTKTQTRRIVKPGPAGVPDPIDGYVFNGYALVKESEGSVSVYPIRCPYGQSGTKLWVRERWAPHDDLAMRQQDREMVHFWADLPEPLPTDMRWRPSIHMPRWASRITLEVTGVRVERLRDISEADARAEGCSASGWTPSYSNPDNAGGDSSKSAADEYAELWESINGAKSWDTNPWVWCVEFRRTA